MVVLGLPTELVIAGIRLPSLGTAIYATGKCVKDNYMWSGFVAAGAPLCSWQGHSHCSVIPSMLLHSGEASDIFHCRNADVACGRGGWLHMAELARARIGAWGLAAASRMALGWGFASARDARMDMGGLKRRRFSRRLRRWPYLRAAAPSSIKCGLKPRTQGA